MSCNQTIHPDSTAFLSGTSRISHVSANEKCTVKFTPSHVFFGRNIPKHTSPKFDIAPLKRDLFKWKVAFQSSISLIQYNSNHLAKTTPLGAGWQLIVLSFKGVSRTQNSALHARLEERGTKSSPKSKGEPNLHGIAHDL